MKTLLATLTATSLLLSSMALGAVDPTTTPPVCNNGQSMGKIRDAAKTELGYKVLELSGEKLLKYKEVFDVTDPSYDAVDAILVVSRKDNATVYVALIVKGCVLASGIGSYEEVMKALEEVDGQKL